MNLIKNDNFANKGISTPPPPKGRVVRSRWTSRLLLFLMVVGPGVIVMVADNDAGAVSTYTQAGYQYGTTLFWLMLLLLPCTYFVQEMVVRLGIATGEGHAAMIYKRFGKWWGVFSLVDLQVVNFLTLVTEFAAISMVATAMGVPPLIAVPFMALALIAVACTGSYLRWERATIALCILNVVWLLIAIPLGRGAQHPVRNMFLPTAPLGGFTGDAMFLIIAIVGTTIAPWQLFFQQSCVADKRLRFSDLKWERLDTFIGSILTQVFAVAMMIAGDAARRHGISLPAGKDFDPTLMATFLGTHGFGPVVRNCILLLTVDAAILGATAISLSSAWAYGEVKGWPHSLELSVRKAPGFYAIYALCVAMAAGLVLIPKAPLELIIISVQVVAGIMLPSAIIFLQLLLNDKELLGERFVNKPWNNWVNWIIIILLFSLSFILAAQVLLQR